MVKGEYLRTKKIMFYCFFCRFIGCFDLFKEIILCRPDVNVLLELSSFLKVTSQNAAFVEQFCTTKPQNALKLNVKEGFFMYNRSN